MLQKTFLTPLAMLALAMTANSQEISPVLFGQNYWLGDGAESRTGYLHLLWPKVESSGVQLIRIGGIAYNESPPSPTRWTAMVDSIQSIGAEPLLQVPYTFSAKEAAALVAHFNGGDRERVQYWSIGNEPMLHDEHTLEEVHEYLSRIAPAMREADPTITILISDEAWLREPVYEALCGGELDMTGKDEKGRWLVDGFSFHSYPNGPEFDREAVVSKSADSIRENVKTLVGLMEAADQKHGRVGQDKLVWALTEFNVTYANPDRDVEGYGNTSFLAGQFFAEVFGIGMEFGALTVAPWCINEPDNVATDFGYLGLLPDFAPRSSYYHSQLLAENFKGSFVKTVSNDPLLKLLGSRSERQVSVLLMNQDLEKSRKLTLSLSLDGSDFQLDAGLEKELEIEVSSQSSKLLVLNARGKIVKVVEYDLYRNLRKLPPLEQKR